LTPPAKITKLAIGIEGGVAVDTDEVKTEVEARCLSCGLILNGHHDKLNTVINELMHAPSASEQEELRAWQEDIVSCEHCYSISQDPVHLGSMDSCFMCDLKANLWLCLTCGYVGCGRKQFDGTGGNDHGLKHYEETLHPIVCKLGTITPEGTAGRGESTEYISNIAHLISIHRCLLLHLQRYES
jgi:ubiquitin carboxyl-terminal hydrolase 5/13